MLLPDSLSLFGIYYTRRWALVAENRVSHRRTGPTRREDGAPAADIPASLPPCPSTCPGMLHTYIHVRVPGLQHVRHRDRSRPRLPPTHGSSPLLPSLPPPPPPIRLGGLIQRRPGSQALARPIGARQKEVDMDCRPTEEERRRTREGTLGLSFTPTEGKTKTKKSEGKTPRTLACPTRTVWPKRHEKQEINRKKTFAGRRLHPATKVICQPAYLTLGGEERSGGDLDPVFYAATCDGMRLRNEPSRHLSPLPYGCHLSFAPSFRPREVGRGWGE